MTNYFFFPFLKDLVFNKETNQPGLSNSLHLDRLGQADREADKNPGVWETTGCHEDGDSPRAGLVHLGRENEGGSYCCLRLPSRRVERSWSQTSCWSLEVTFSCLLKLGCAQGQDKQ